MIEVAVSNQWRKVFPGAHIGMLLMGNVDNTKRPTLLDELKKEVVSTLRSTYAGYSRADLHELNVLKVYKSYYKKFNKTYHLQLQLDTKKQKTCAAIFNLLA
jgi:DNA/RNA-binding domain of Phe-tRNA-synthetase-like protein